MSVDRSSERRRDFLEYPLVAAGIAVGKSKVAQLNVWQIAKCLGMADVMRRLRIRDRKKLRKPFVYSPNDITHKKAHHRITLGDGSSHRRV